jgi:hypothetical protein
VKPEEYLMRKNYQMEDKLEKKIKMRCEKIMNLEMKGFMRKKEEKQNIKMKQKIKGNLKQNRDRNSINKNGKMQRESYKSLKRGEFDSVQNDLDNPFDVGRRTMEKMQPLLANDDEEENMGDFKFDKMNISQLMDYSKKRKLSYEASVFSTVMIRKDNELIDDHKEEGEVKL